VVTIAVPLMMVMFARIESYYAEVAHELHLGKTPPRPHKRESIVIVPTSTVNTLTERVLSAAQRRRLGDSEDRRVRVGSMRDPERIQAPKELLGSQRRLWHRQCTMRPAIRESKPCKAGLPD
jgi:hypothetical protein